MNLRGSRRLSWGRPDKIPSGAGEIPRRLQPADEAGAAPPSAHRPATGAGVELVKAEVRVAVDELYREQYRPLLGFARGLAVRYQLPDPGRDAEDVVQAVFAAAIEQWPTLVNPPAWLYTVTRYQLVRAVAEARRHGVVLDADDLQDQVTSGGRWTSLARRPDPQDVLLARQVVEAVARLGSDRQRIATYLRHVQGWSTEEIAELLECAPGTVWTHTHRGVQTVRFVVDVGNAQGVSIGDYNIQRNVFLGRRQLGRRQRCRWPWYVLAVLVIAALIAGWVMGWPVPWVASGLAAAGLSVVVYLFRLVRRE